MLSDAKGSELGTLARRVRAQGRDATSVSDARLRPTADTQEWGRVTCCSRAPRAAVAGHPDPHPLVPCRSLGATASPRLETGRPTRDGLRRRHECASAPKGGGGR